LLFDLLILLKSLLVLSALDLVLKHFTFKLLFAYFRTDNVFSYVESISCTSLQIYSTMSPLGNVISSTLFVFVGSCDQDLHVWGWLA